MKRKGWMAAFAAFVMIVMIAAATLMLTAVLSAFLTLGLSHTIDEERGYIKPFLVCYMLAPTEYDSRLFFQEISYVASGENFYDSFDANITEKANIISYNYIISLFSKRLISNGISDRTQVFTAYVPVFTFEKGNNEFGVGM